MNDILHADGDILDLSGDFIIGDSSQQEILIITQSQPGEWRQWPLMGVGIEQYLNAPIDVAQIQKDIRRMLRYDGFQNIKINIENGLNVSAERL